MKKIITSRRFAIAVLIAILAMLGVLVMIVVRDTYWLYGVDVVLAALLGACVALIFDTMYPPENPEEEDDDEDDEEE